MRGARTPLFALLRRAMATARAAAHAAEPLDEFLDRVAEARCAYPRRRFLRNAALGGGALLAAACTGRVPRPDEAEEVAIVGAGIAGLTAAWRLRQAGVRVRVYEANNRIGGRMLSLRGHFPDEQVVELGGELIDTDHTHIRALAAELGLELDDLSADHPDLDHEVWHFEGRRYSERELIAALPPLAAAIARDYASLPEDDITYRHPGGAEALDRLSIAQWLERNGVHGWLRALIEVAYTTEMGRECEEQSALNLITFIEVGPDGFAIFGDSDERFHVRGGNDLIVHGLAGRLEDAIETGLVLEALRREAGGGHVLSLRDGHASREVRARQVLLALPFTTLRRVRLDVDLPAVKRRAIDELGYGDNAKLMIGFDHRVWREHGSNGSLFTDLPLQSTWETSRAQAGRHGILTNFTGGGPARELGTGSARQQADRVVAELEAVWPGIGAARQAPQQVRFHWPTQPWALGSYACYLPGQWTTLRGAPGEAVGRLYFAGEHCALDSQGFMEGGCESGEDAAAQILAARGRGRRAA